MTGRHLAITETVLRGAAWNLLGRGAPILIAVAATPFLIERLGPSRWGVFTLALSLVGVSGIFDFGIGRALTRAVAERVGAGDEDTAASLVMTGICTVAVLGIAGGLTMAWGVENWVRSSLKIPGILHDEVVTALYVLCASVPLVILNSAMWGVIAAYQQFRAANLINMPFVAIYYLGPLALLPFWNSLAGVMLILVCCRLALTCGYWLLCLHSLPTLRHARPDRRELRLLLKLGGWMTVSNITWPLLSYLDRFIMASILSVAESGYYATAFDSVARLSIITIAINVSAYPAMAGTFRLDPANTVRLFRRTILLISSLLFPACMVVAGFSTPLLTIWLGADFAGHAAPVARWLGIGTMALSIDAVVSGLIDGIGRPDVNAKLSLLELAFSVPLLIVLLHGFGIEGAAIAWAFRTSIDLVVRVALASRLYPASRPAIKMLGPAMTAAIALPALPLIADGTILRLSIIVAASVTYVIVTFRWSITDLERRFLLNQVQWLLSRSWQVRL